MKIAHAIMKNRLSLFAESHLPFLKIAYAIFSPCGRGIGYWIFPRVFDLALLGGRVAFGRQANFPLSILNSHALPLSHLPRGKAYREWDITSPDCGRRGKSPMPIPSAIGMPASWR